MGLTIEEITQMSVLLMEAGLKNEIKLSDDYEAAIVLTFTDSEDCMVMPGGDWKYLIMWVFYQVPDRLIETPLAATDDPRLVVLIVADAISRRMSEVITENQAMAELRSEIQEEGK